MLSFWPWYYVKCVVQSVLYGGHCAERSAIRCCDAIGPRPARTTLRTTGVPRTLHDHAPADQEGNQGTQWIRFTVVCLQQCWTCCIYFELSMSLTTGWVYRAGDRWVASVFYVQVSEKQTRSGFDGRSISQNSSGTFIASVLFVVIFVLHSCLSMCSLIGVCWNSSELFCSGYNNVCFVIRCCIVLVHLMLYSDWRLNCPVGLYHLKFLVEQ